MRLTYPTAMVLHALASGRCYGFDIIDATGLKAGTVYPILRRLDEAGLVRSNWESPEAPQAEGRPPRRNYRMTGTGREMAREALERYPALTRLIVSDGGEPVTA